MEPTANAFENLMGIVLSQFNGFNFLDFFDIVIVALIIYKLIDFIRESRAAQLVKGIVLLLVLLQVSQMAELDATYFLLKNTMQVGLIALIVVFQPELRRVLEQMGRSRIGLNLFVTGSEAEEEIIDMIEEISSACAHLSEKSMGALIAFERVSNLTDIMQSGTKIDSRVSKELLESIFFENNPLHDGAVIIRDARIVSAACILPLTQNHNLSKELGTRHRAAIGLSENSDALVVVVSEETGKISIVTDGHIRRGYKLESLRDSLQNTFLRTHEEKENFLTKTKKSIKKFFEK